MNTQLRIDSLRMDNFRCFKQMEKPVLFERDLTVLVARNGEGKTAFLDAVKIALGTFTGSFPITTHAHFHSSDAHIAMAKENSVIEANYPISLYATGIVGGEKVEWSRSLHKVKGRTTTKEARGISDYGKKLLADIKLGGASISLPLIAFYGTGRLWAEHRDMDDGEISPLAQTRYSGYENALSARSNYKQVKNWLLEALKLEDSKTSSQTQTGQFILTQLRAVKRALKNALATEFLRDMHYNPFYKDDITVVCGRLPEEGNIDSNDAASLPISWLSDGLRAIFSMVADIAYRCAKLNPHLGERACEETCGIVMIDEIDLHLHPSWQRHVVKDLHKTFPNIQFILTTHSPGIVSSVDAKYIRILNPDHTVSTSTLPVDAYDINNVLAQVFGVSPWPDSDASGLIDDLHKFSKLTSCYEDHREEWEKMKERLLKSYGNNFAPLNAILQYHAKRYNIAMG